jgi:DNA-binding response OmpR family regulator
MRIFLAEDDTLLGDGLFAGLKIAGYAVDWVRDGEHALQALKDQTYDLCILDLGLPRCDGLTILKDLRSRRDSTPVLILTARDASQDRVSGLDAGADDYLTKPFDLPELLARIRALTRRAGGNAACLPIGGESAPRPNWRKGCMHGARKWKATRWKCMSIICARNWGQPSSGPCVGRVTSSGAMNENIEIITQPAAGIADGRCTRIMARAWFGEL